MWELGHKEGWAPKNWCFHIVVLKKIWESLGQQDQTSQLKEINPEYSLEGLMLKMKLQYFGDLIWRADSLEKTLMLGKIENRRWRGRQKIGMVGWYQRINGHEFEQAPGIGGGQGSLACCSPRGRKESDMTEWLKWTDETFTKIDHMLNHKIILTEIQFLLYLKWN